MSSSYPIAVFVGSLRRDSINRRLATALARLAPPEFSFSQVDISDLPLYDQDANAHQAGPVQRLKAEIEAARGLLFVTPEYNRSIPGVLKNAVDHASRPYGHNSWGGKPAAIIGMSPGGIGTALAQAHLRTVLAAVDVPTLTGPEAYIQARDGLFDADGNIAAESGSRAFLQSFMDRYGAWVKALA